jgi:hypothetical protein
MIQNGPKRRIIRVRCDECYERTELVRGAVGYKELWPEKAANCKHQPVKSCPSLKAAFTRARAFTRL